VPHHTDSLADAKASHLMARRGRVLSLTHCLRGQFNYQLDTRSSGYL